MHYDCKEYELLRKNLTFLNINLAVLVQRLVDSRLIELPSVTEKSLGNSYYM